MSKSQATTIHYRYVYYYKDYDEVKNKFQPEIDLLYYKKTPAG